MAVEESLRNYTENVAYQMHRENSVGKLEVGFAADMVVLNKNPLTVDPKEISTIEVLATYKSGRRFEGKRIG